MSSSGSSRSCVPDRVILDDLMFMSLDRQEAHLFFQIFLTSNKGLEDWGELLEDPAVTTTILDRILH